MLIDTHCHLDAGEFDADRSAMIAAATAAGVGMMIVPAVVPDNFAAVRDLAHAHPGVVYALGVHPLFVEQAGDDWFERLGDALMQWRDDPRLVSVGEIGLDNFVPDADTDKQERVFEAQLRLAVRFDMPVILHVRRAQDRVLRYLRRVPVRGGIAHAFNGSRQQADQFIERGFALGFGGAMTHARARNIRRLAADLPAHALVLETDSPDIAPEWLSGQRNDPAQLPRMAQVLADLRGTTIATVIDQTAANACRVLPALGGLTGLSNDRPRDIDE